MTYKESYTVELKRELNTDFKKEIIALASCDGGEIYVGPLLGISGEVRKTATLFHSYYTIKESLNNRATLLNIKTLQNIF